MVNKYFLFILAMITLLPFVHLQDYDISPLDETVPSYGESGPSEKDLKTEIDCDEMVNYFKTLHRHYDKECKEGDCDEKKKAASEWFRKAYKQLGKKCYSDEYDYLDFP
ncbi:uncharacterized protein LOC129743630 [Uranotaenia lowii]|uniref:uncharacterized protein LOC129743630 n=1 Tax=Uranotaenia lowii TaxID=190385 RepID=UPI00247B1D22|nr:uncharacterized protein LOC129743630 [Uranotaenia lowii]